MQLYNAELNKRIYVRNTPSFSSDSRSESDTVEIYLCFPSTNVSSIRASDYTWLFIMFTDNFIDRSNYDFHPAILYFGRFGIEILVVFMPE